MHENIEKSNENLDKIRKCENSLTVIESVRMKKDERNGKQVAKNERNIPKETINRTVVCPIFLFGYFSSKSMNRLNESLRSHNSIYDGNYNSFLLF